jgi:hypothetical protein
VMQRVWDAMREQGYRLYTAMIRAYVVAGRKLTIYRGEFRLKFDQGV